MKSFAEAKQAYIADHLSKDLKQPERRINALKAIEQSIKTNSPGLITSDEMFKIYTKDEFKTQYHRWKSAPLSSAEKSVITGLFNFSI